MSAPGGYDDLDRWEKLAAFWRENYEATRDPQHLWLADRFRQLCDDAAAQADAALQIVLDRYAARTVDAAAGKRKGTGRSDARRT
jgi:transcriptional regulator GlxA family with amidase domain